MRDSPAIPNPGIPGLVSPGEEEDLPACPAACPPPGREVLTMKRTLLQLILAASACLQLDGKCSAGFSSPGILSGITAPVWLLHRVTKSQKSLSWMGATKIIRSNSQFCTALSPGVPPRSPVVQMLFELSGLGPDQFTPLTPYQASPLGPVTGHGDQCLPLTFLSGG